MAPSRVREDDGTLVPFRERKIADGIATALSSAGESDRALAEELAGVVTLFIDRAFPNSPPAVADILDLSERVLEETGHIRAARAFRRLRQQREELRQLLAVRRIKTLDADALEHSADGEDPALAAWSRSRLVGSLMDEDGVPAPMAQDIASAVEKRLIDGGFSVVTTTLIAEYAAHELFLRGIASRSGHQGHAEVPWRDVARAIYADEEESTAPDAAVAGGVLARFALKELHAPPVVRAHRTGRIHIVGLDHPVAVERATVPVALLLGDSPPSDLRRALLRVRAALGALRPHVRDSVYLPDLVGFVASRADFETADLVDDLLLAVVPHDAYGRPVRPIAELAVPITGFEEGPAGQRAAKFVQALLRRAATTKPGFRVRLAIAPTPVHEELLDVIWPLVLSLLQVHPATPLLAIREGDHSPWPSVPRYPERLLLSVGRVAVNLPLLLLDVAGKSLPEAIPDLKDGVKVAADAMFEKLWTQRRGPAFGVHGIIHLFGGPSRVQVTADGQEADFDLWGLPIALSLLVSRGLIAESGRAEATARILAAVTFTAGEARDHLRLVPVVGAVRERSIRRRLLEATASAATRFGVDDMKILLSTEVGAEGALPVVAPLWSRSNHALLSGAFAEHLGPGLSIPTAALPDGLVPSFVRDIHSMSRLKMFTFSSGTASVFEVQEELF